MNQVTIVVSTVVFDTTKKTLTEHKIRYLRNRIVDCETPFLSYSLILVYDAPLVLKLLYPCTYCIHKLLKVLQHFHQFY